MTLSGGLTNTGFVALTQAEIFANLVAGTLASPPCAGLDLSPDQAIGQLWGIGSQALAQLYELGATVYNALNPSAAEGALLVSACALSGTVPQSATYSLCTCTVNLSAGATLTAGFTAYVVGQPTNTWVLLTTVTNSGGTSANFSAFFRSTLPGPFAANINTLTQPSVTTTGLNSITNAAAAVPGNLADTDTTLRARRAEELTGQGNGDVDAIRAHLLDLLGMQSAFVTSNTGFATAADGTPGKSIHAIIWDGPSLAVANNTIAQTLWTSKPAGIATYGASSGVATDSQGNSQTMNFDRATQEPVFLQFTTTPSSLTTAQTAAVKQAVLNYTNGTVDADGNVLTPANIGLGQTVVALALRSAALSSLVVTDVPTLTLQVGSYGSGTANIAITSTEIATFAVGNMLVNGV